VKNLREWVGLLFVLFCVLDIAAVQYGLHLFEISPDHPDPVLGQIVALIHGHRKTLSFVYVTPRQITVLYGFLSAAGAALLATLGLLVGDGMRLAYAVRRPAQSSVQRKRQDHPRP
jgi:hypothetical protein